MYGLGRSGSEGINMLTPKELGDVQSLCDRGRYANAVKEVMRLTGLGLAEAKLGVDYYREHGEWEDKFLRPVVRHHGDLRVPMTPAPLVYTRKNDKVRSSVSGVTVTLREYMNSFCVSSDCRDMGCANCIYDYTAAKSRKEFLKLMDITEEE